MMTRHGDFILGTAAPPAGRSSLNQSQVRNLTGVISPLPTFAGQCLRDIGLHHQRILGDTWVIQNGKGALTYLGASNNSYWDRGRCAGNRVIFDTL
jgi:hypothetical protein